MVALTLTFLVVMTIAGVKCYPNGVGVDDACTDLRPRHDGSPKTTPPPYNITIATTTYNGTQNVQLTLSSCSSFQFKGFMIQARDRNNSAIGTFNSISGTRSACNGTALVHSDKNNKALLTLTWVPPANSNADVIFRTTFVREEDEYWVNVVSDTLFNKLSGNTNIIAQKTILDWNCTVNSADFMWHGPYQMYTLALLGMITSVLTLW